MLTSSNLTPSLPRITSRHHDSMHAISKSKIENRTSNIENRTWNPTEEPSLMIRTSTARASVPTDGESIRDGDIISYQWINRPSSENGTSPEWPNRSSVSVLCEDPVSPGHIRREHFESSLLASSIIWSSCHLVMYSVQDWFRIRQSGVSSTADTNV